MRKIIVLFLVYALLLMVGCDADSNTFQGSDLLDYLPDYYDAESFESDLNSGVKVSGKIVQFYVNDYRPDSALGINTWAGEHLNFISKEKLDVEPGDYVIGRVTSEPTKILFGESWKIPYEVLEIRDDAIEETTAVESTNVESEKETTTPTQEEVTETTPIVTATPTTVPATEETVLPTAESKTEPPHVHSFRDATCTDPKTCSCGETEGKANGHSWKDATCSEPKTCTVCGTTSGLTAGHSFVSGKCASCGKTDPDYRQETMVWIPTKGGTKYHSNSSCSGMEDPSFVTKSKAEALGFTACKKCH